MVFGPDFGFVPRWVDEGLFFLPFLFPLLGLLSLLGPFFPRGAPLSLFELPPGWFKVLSLGAPAFWEEAL